MRQHIRDFAEICGQVLPMKEPIYEFGSLWPKSQWAFADLRPFFPGKQYVGVDMQEGEGVDLVASLPNTGIPDESAGTILCFDTLEHVEDLREALEEFKRILKDGGLLVATSVFSFPIHCYPQDFWRFTPQGFESLFRDFKGVKVGHIGDSLSPSTIYAYGFKGEVSAHNEEKAKEDLLAWKVRTEK